MKLNRILILSILSIFISTGVLASSQDIRIILDGERLHTEVSAEIVNSRTLVPMRAIFEALGVNIDWNKDTKTIVGTKGSDKIILTIESTKGRINGKDVNLESPPIIIDGRTLVPIRFIAESLGSNVDWNKDTRTVIINSTGINEEDVISNIENIELEVLRLVNIERANQGIRELEISDELSDLARIKSQDMADDNYFDHTSPTYGSPFDMMKKFGINYSAAAENIAKGQVGAKDVMNSWMNSEGHRENILNSNYGTLGVGYVNDGRTTYWTQMFTD